MTTPRAEFMRRLSELEDLHFAAGVQYGARTPAVGDAPLVEAIRMARRRVVAAYDQAGLLAGICQDAGSDGLRRLDGAAKLRSGSEHDTKSVTLEGQR